MPGPWREPPTLQRVARGSIEHGLLFGRPWPVDDRGFGEAWRGPAATFVTLRVAGELRGCSGILEARRPLVVDVAENAFAAAFLDPRFPPLASEELVRLHLHISRLSPLEPLEVGSEEDLLGRLEPGVHGVVLSEGERRATFLPQVWESLPDPREFLRHLRLKAGLDPGAWSDRLRVHRYTVETIE